MQIDELLAALTNMRQHLMVVGGAYDADQVYERLNIIGLLRDYTLKEDASAFSDYLQSKLMGPQGDTISDIISELWEELGIGSEDTIWEDFDRMYLK